MMLELAIMLLLILFSAAMVAAVVTVVVDWVYDLWIEAKESKE